VSVKPDSGPDSRLVTRVHAAANVEPRHAGAKPELLILHYTGMSSAAKAIDWLARAESRVSCHYVIDEGGRITQMVPERLRAWHAGVSSWHGKTDINSRSIGIEIQNPGHEHGYPDFPDAQMKAVLALSKDIVARHGMRPESMLAHSDVAPERKIDPGEKFNWAKLAKAGLGLCAGAKGETVLKAQKLLAAYGYDTTATGEFDPKMAKVVRAFQLHFRPAKVDGRLDHSTLRTLERLVAALNVAGS
jgi:N-acetylmuramoyl-L-alanine amidase